MNPDLLEEIPKKPVIKWILFSKEEYKSSIIKCNNSLTPGSNKLFWKYLEVIINDSSCLKNFINIVNVVTTQKP